MSSRGKRAAARSPANTPSRRGAPAKKVRARARRTADGFVDFSGHAARDA
jgi:hypothetical protein